MAGLVGYASSDEDEDIEEVAPTQLVTDTEVSKSAEDTLSGLSGKHQPSEPSPNTATAEPQPTLNEEPAVLQETVASASTAPESISHPKTPAPLGPSLPTGASEAVYLPEPEDEGQEPMQPVPSSPYSAERALLRDLTLPTHPNLDIPPSPPGSPNSALTKKIDHFLELKKKGIHFNNKLADSPALRNPALMDKLMSFVEMGGGDGDDRLQYATTLSPDVWDPTGDTFPSWAFRGALRQSQDKVRKERDADKAAGKRTAIEFVGSASGTPGSDGGADSGGLLRGSKRKAGAW